MKQKNNPLRKKSDAKAAARHFLTLVKRPKGAGSAGNPMKKNEKKAKSKKQKATTRQK